MEKEQLFLQLLHPYMFIPTSTVIREMRVLLFFFLKANMFLPLFNFIPSYSQDFRVLNLEVELSY